MNIQDDSFQVTDEWNLKELPSFNLPRNLLLNGTGKKNYKFSEIDSKSPFWYKKRERIAMTSYSASPTRPSDNFSNKISLLNPSICSMASQKLSAQKSPETGPIFKKKQLEIVKPVCLQPNNSDVWAETETESEYQTDDWDMSSKATPNFNKFQELSFGNSKKRVSRGRINPELKFEQISKIRDNIKKLKSQKFLYKMTSSNSWDRAKKGNKGMNPIFNFIFKV